MMRLLLIASLLMFMCPLDAQSSVKSLSDEADFIIEGRVVEQQSIWDAKRDNIYTFNTIKVSRLFKGELKTDFVQIATRGGIVGDDFQIVTHHLQLRQDQEGVFFCKKHDRRDITSSPILVVNGIHSFIEYKNPTKSSFGTAYTNLSNLHTEIAMETGSPTILGTNSFEDQLATLIQDNFSLVSDSDNIIFFSFENVQITDGGNKVEFDIYAMSNINGVRFAASEIILNYNQNAFGSFVVANEKIQAEKRSILDNQVYTLELTDEGRKRTYGGTIFRHRILV